MSAHLRPKAFAVPHIFRPIFVSLAILASAPAWADAKSETPPEQRARVNLQDSDPLAKAFCGNVVDRLASGGVQGMCFVNEVAGESDHLEALVVLQYAEQGKTFAATAALGVMTMILKHEPRIAGKRFSRMRSQAGEIKLLLPVADAMDCLAQFAEEERRVACLHRHTQQF